MRIDAPGRGKKGFEEAKAYLDELISDKKLTLEYDTYQDDKFGRILAYIWTPCIHKIRKFCHGEKALVNEIIYKEGLAKKIVYEKRKKLKYADYFQ